MAGALAFALLGAALLAAAGLAVVLARQRRRTATPADTPMELEWLSLFAQRTSNSLVITDPARRIVWVNEGFERLTGYDLDQARGRSPAELLQFEGTDPLTIAVMRDALERRVPVNCEICNRSREGREYWLAIEIQPMFHADGRLQGFISIQYDATERRLAAQALHASQALLARTGRIAGVGGWAFDLRHRRFEWTAQTAALLGRDPDVPPTLRQAVGHCARPDRRRFIAELRRMRQVGHACDLQLPFVTRPGRTLWVRLAAEVEYGDGGPVRVVGALQDITQRVAMKAEVQRSADLLRGAIDALDDAFVLYDAEDRLVFCNEPFRQLYATVADHIAPGISFEALLRLGLERGQFPAAQGQEEAWLQRRLQAHREGGSSVQRLDNGRIVRVAERTLPDGHRLGFRVDITELVAATEKAERADQGKSEIIATMSHELRTPLQSITGFSDLGRHFAADHPQYGPMFEDIHAGGMRMLKLVNALLDVSKFDGGMGQLQPKPVDPMALVAEVARELAPQAQAKALQLHIDAPTPALHAELDAFRMQQVLRNVLANALRFAPAGTEVRVSGHDDGRAGLRIDVRDHGPGIPPDEAETVFEAFVQSSRTRNGAGGTGLGLAISRRIMKAHGGSLEAVQPDGPGALLRLRFPGASPSSSASAAGGARSLRALRLQQQRDTTPA